MKQRLDKHFLLNRAFVGTLLAIAVPIALQNMISFGVAVMADADGQCGRRNGTRIRRFQTVCKRCERMNY